MKTIIKNPAAFPLKHSEDKFNPGMTLRDYFAGQAIAGILSNQKLIEDLEHGHEYVELAYYVADELLLKRQYDESKNNG